MSPLIAAAAAATGYLIGSVSFARLIARLVAPGKDVTKIECALPESDEIFRSDSVSSTAARIHLGTRYGCLTAILDILKVALPTLAFKLWQPDVPYYLIVAAMGLVGHDWPIYHRFRGGRGESPIYGALLVIDPLGVLVTNLAGSLLGIIVGHLLVLRWVGLVLMIPWLWFRTESWPHLGYILFANGIYWTTMSGELRQYVRLSRIGVDLSQEQIADLFAMGKPLGRLMDHFSLLSLYKNRHKKAG
jgi:acyl phosphate:glycerol-3-phosphate acyltransferase